MRLKLILGKYRVIKVERSLGRLTFVVSLGKSSLEIVPPYNLDADVREGDLLTFYTEVLHATPIEPSIQ